MNICIRQDQEAVGISAEEKKEYWKKERFTEFSI